MVVFLDKSVRLTEIEIENYLRTSRQLKPVCQEILYQIIISQAAQERNLMVTEEEIQAEADRQRREMQLEKAVDTLAWLEDQLITSDDWEAGIRGKLLRTKLAESLFSTKIEPFFAQNKLNFDQVLLYQIIVPYKQLAWEIFYQIEEEEMSFYQAAHLYDISEERRHHCGYEGKLYRWSLKPEIASVIFCTQPREVINPIKSEQGYHILLVEEFIPAELTPETYQEILNKMFEDWLTSEFIYRLHNSREKPATSQQN